MPGEPGVTVVTTLVCSFYFACEAAGAFRAPGIPCALRSLRASIIPLSSGKTCREAAIPWALSHDSQGAFDCVRNQKWKCLDQESRCRNPDALPPGFEPIETVGRIPQAVGTAYKERLTLPFSYRHRRSLLPQFQREAGASRAWRTYCVPSARVCCYGHKATQKGLDA
jgi:hypothetical protein